MTQASTHRITGRGQLNATLVNNGLVSADQNGTTLLLQTNLKTNNGTMEATSGGTLQVSTDIAQGGSGLIRANGGDVNLSGVFSITGGSLGSISGTFVRNSGSTGTLASVTNNAPVTLNTGTSLAISGTGIVNNGQVVVNTTGGGAATILNFDSGNLNGTGEVRLNSNSSFAQLNSTGSMTQASTHRITGRGNLNATLVNEGLVRADVAGAGIALVLQTNPKTNNGTMEATSGGTLQVSTDITQGGSGLIRANGGDVGLTGAFSITGGTLASPSGVVTRGGGGVGTLTDVTNNAQLNISAGTNLAISGTGIVNNGQVVVNTTGVGSTSILNFVSGNLGGTGEVRLNSSSSFAQLNSTGSMTQASTHRIVGRGVISTTLVNNGLVSADFAGVPLELRTNPKTNNNIMQAVSGGILDIEGITITQSPGGVIQAAGGDVTLTLTSGVTGGRLASTGGVFTQTGLATLTDVTNDATVNIPASADMNIAGSGLVNNGRITVNLTGGGSVSILAFTSATSLTGTGEIRLNSSSSFAQLNSTSPVTQGAGHRITGRGDINAALISNGLVHADGGNTLDLQTGAKTNNGLMMASNASTLVAAVSVNGTGSWLADGGTIQLSSGTQITTSGSVTAIRGGHVNMTNANNVLMGSDMYIGQGSRLTAAGGVTLSRNYMFHQTTESQVTWATGSTLTMTGGTGGTGCNTNTWGFLEVGGTDNGTGGSGTNNFGMANVTIGANAAVTLGDFFDNGNRGGPSGTKEALYASSLTLNAGAKLNLNGVHMYVGGVLIGTGPRGGGTVVDTPVVLTGDLNCDGFFDGRDVTAWAVAALNPGGYPGLFPGCSPCAGDMDGDGTPLTSADLPIFVNALTQAIAP